MPALAYRDTLPTPDNPGILLRVCEAVRKGHSIRATAALAGISKDTLMGWLTQGRRDMAEAQAEGRELGSHGLFAAQVELAYAELEEAKLGVIEDDTQAAPAGRRWMPAMAVLRSRNPEEWVEKPGREGFVVDQSQHLHFSFNVTAQLDQAGYARLLEAMAHEGGLLLGPGGITPDPGAGDVPETPDTPGTQD